MSSTNEHTLTVETVEDSDVYEEIASYRKEDFKMSIITKHDAQDPSMKLPSPAKPIPIKSD